MLSTEDMSSRCLSLYVMIIYPNYLIAVPYCKAQHKSIILGICCWLLICVAHLLKLSVNLTPFTFLKDYHEEHPEVTVLDPPNAINHLNNRQSMLAEVSDLNLSSFYGNHEA